MRILFCTNLPSPYRVDFFNVLGQHCELTVAYERRSGNSRDAKWQGVQERNYREEFLPLKPLGEESSIGGAMRRFIRDHSFDRIILSNYNSPACMEAIAWCRIKKIPYCMEYDGGFFKRDKLLLRLLKQWLLKPAELHFSTCDGHIAYLKSLGICEEQIVKYPFSSLGEKDMAANGEGDREQKNMLRKKLHIQEKFVVLTVGRFIPFKAFDVLLKSAQYLPKSVGVYFVGGEPTEEYLHLQKRYNLTNVHFVGFCEKAALAEYYRAADLFAFPSRDDIWGLVVNEAMSFGLPVITTNRCAAGLELIENGMQGYVVPVDDVQALADKINLLCSDVCQMREMGRQARKRILPYTTERMAYAHMDSFGLQRKA